MNEDLSLLISTVEKIAPTLAGLLAGPEGAMAVNLLESIFRVNIKDLPAAITADPEAASKLQLAKLQHDDMTMRYYSVAEQAVVDDRKSARERELELVKEGKKDWIPHIIAILYIGLLIAIVILNYFVTLKDDHIMTMLIGFIMAGIGKIIAYYFGGDKIS